MDFPRLLNVAGRWRVGAAVRAVGPWSMHNGNIAAVARYSTTYTPPEPAPDANEGEKRLHEKLVKELKPIRLQVVDVSGGCGSMYAIDIASPSFEGVPTVKQHRMVNEVLKEDIKGMHGLQLRTSPK
ncbi:bola protein [Cladochytrium replicatum]|nr:bola protein [Cladochytrium replicatum]